MKFSGFILRSEADRKKRLINRDYGLWETSFVVFETQEEVFNISDQQSLPKAIKRYFGSDATNLKCKFILTKTNHVYKLLYNQIALFNYCDN
jgi:hypothetical protein